MLSKEENRILTEVGPGTPMGNLLRRYWIPAALASKVSEPNGDPLRVRLVGENFVLWRDGAGRRACFDEYCMHRGASLALAHCEGDGLRCLYHGWKYATDGTILETPNYKRSHLKERLKAPVYPVREAGGLIWVYLGPREKEPPFPHYKFMDLPSDQLPIYHATFDCSFVQMMEGTIDPSHRLILHQDSLGSNYTKSTGGSLVAEIAAGEFVSEDAAPVCEVEDTLFGCHGVAILDAVADGVPTKYARVHTWVMPFLAIPTSDSFVMSVPMDDTHTTFFAVNAWVIPDKAERDAYVEQRLAGPAEHYVDSHYRWTENERWGQDRSRMSESFTGVDGTVPEDLAIVLSMGPVYDRSKEHLVPADRMIIRMRRRLLESAGDLQAGREPFMLRPDDSVNLGGNGRLLSEPERWQELMVPGNEPFRVTNTRRSGELPLSALLE